MIPWIYNNKEVLSKDIQDYYGFVYKIIYDNNTAYIGKKVFFNSNTLIALKNGKQRPNSQRIGKNKKGKRVYLDIVKKESNWQKYIGSSKTIPEKLTITKREILAFAKDKRELTYIETKYLFMNEVLESNKFHNDNILGKFFKPKGLL